MIAIFPQITQCAASGDIEQLVVLVRQYYGQDETFSPKIDVKKLMRNAGFTVESMALDCHAALLARDEGGKFQIAAVLNENLSEFSQNFTLAHMLGHYFLDIEPLIAKGEWQVSGYRELSCPLDRFTGQVRDEGLAKDELRKEMLASRFAAALLLPKSMVVKAYEKFSDETKCAEFFAVTMACLQKRMEDFIGAKEMEPGNFLDAASQLGVDISPVGEAKPTKKGHQTLFDRDTLLKAPLVEQKLPKTIATASYRHPKNEVKAPKSTGPIKKGAQKADAENTPPILKGMERIREIARLMDKDV